VARGALDLFDTPFNQVEEVMALAREAYRDNWWVVHGVKGGNHAVLEPESAPAGDRDPRLQGSHRPVPGLPATAWRAFVADLPG
jgi:hypothetical protein